MVEDRTMLDTVIVGGGLCGLALAGKLQDRGCDYALFEARERLGGRILSVRCETARMMVDLGPAWFWPQLHRRMHLLVAELGLSSFPQWQGGAVTRQVEAAPRAIPDDGAHGGAHRVEGGAGAVVGALAARLDPERLRLGCVLSRVEDEGGHVRLHFLSRDQRFDLVARRLVLALPPRLLEERIEFGPALADPLRQALRRAPTWMAQQAKVVIGYERAFWREAELPGKAFADHSRAVLGEIHDACNGASTGAALEGFVSLPPALRSAYRNGLPLLLRSQLAQIFGHEAQRGEKHFQDWASETFTCSSLDRSAPGEAPRCGAPLLQSAHWEDKLFFGGTETARYGGGYMEGALEAAGRICQALARAPAVAAA
jgi:monoamine oxidase